MRQECDADPEAWSVAQAWCAERGNGWSIRGEVGRGGTSVVFDLTSLEGDRTLKIYNEKFSSDRPGEIEATRIQMQRSLGVHDCPSLVKIYDGGRFQDRHFLLMSRAPGQELGKILSSVPRDKIRHILDQVTRACIYLRGMKLCHRDIKSANIFVSDDFEQATLLDLSVARDIHDPIGLGTDYDGQLPVVATARYSPPEYLFRLLEPGPNSCHALDVYQLGALLHDLIMRKPLFEDEYIHSKKNRYRFAWIVATNIPEIAAGDVDQDLIFIAGRALDKDWERRASLALEDFLNDQSNRTARALEALGLSKRTSLGKARSTKAVMERITASASGIKERMRDHLYSQGVTAQHRITPGPDDFSRVVEIFGLGTQEDGVYLINIALVEYGSSWFFSSKASLSQSVNGRMMEASLDLPPTKDDDWALERLSKQLEQAFGILAERLVRKG